MEILRDLSVSKSEEPEITLRDLGVCPEIGRKRGEDTQGSECLEE